MTKDRGNESYFDMNTSSDLGKHSPSKLDRT